MALSITAQQEALSSPLSAHSHGLALPNGLEEEGVPLVLCLQNWKVPKKYNTTDLCSPKQDGARKSAAECNACHTFQPQKGATWCSSLQCTAMHPAHHPRKSKRGLASPAQPSESIPGFLCRPHLLNNMQVCREIRMPCKTWSQGIHPHVSSGVKTLSSPYRRMYSHRK